MIGQRLRHAREAVQMTQQSAAARVGIPRTALSEIETGRRRLAAIELARFAAVYRRTPDQLLGQGMTPVIDPALCRAVAALPATGQAAVLAFAEFLASQIAAGEHEADLTRRPNLVMFSMTRRW